MYQTGRLVGIVDHADGYVHLLSRNGYLHCEVDEELARVRFWIDTSDPDTWYQWRSSLYDEVWKATDMIPRPAHTEGWQPMFRVECKLIAEYALDTAFEATDLSEWVVTARSSAQPDTFRWALLELGVFEKDVLAPARRKLLASPIFGKLARRACEF